MNATTEASINSSKPRRRRHARLLRWRLKMSLLVVGLFSIPLWMYLGLQVLLSPEGFAAEALLLAMAMFVLGWTQLVLWCVMAIALLLIWTLNPLRIARSST